jgi:hypothetical protein
VQNPDHSLKTIQPVPDRFNPKSGKQKQLRRPKLLTLAIMLAAFVTVALGAYYASNRGLDQHRQNAIKQDLQQKLLDGSAEMIHPRKR